jgi:hypothetical protein
MDLEFSPQKYYFSAGVVKPPGAEKLAICREEQGRKATRPAPLIPT